MVVENNKKLPTIEEIGLSRYDNQARVMFHEITHLDYFMNSGDQPTSKSPFVSDLDLYYAWRKPKNWHAAYGPVSTGTGQTSDGRGKAIGVSNPYDLAGSSDKL